MSPSDQTTDAHPGSTEFDSLSLDVMLLRLHNEAYHCFNSEDVSTSPAASDTANDLSTTIEEI